MSLSYVKHRTAPKRVRFAGDRCPNCAKRNRRNILQVVTKFKGVFLKCSTCEYRCQDGNFAMQQCNNQELEDGRCPKCSRVLIFMRNLLCCPLEHFSIAKKRTSFDPNAAQQAETESNRRRRAVKAQQVAQNV